MAERAVALRYEGEGAPSVVATGRGALAEKIVEAAREAGVPVREDPLLVEALGSLELGVEVPPELYKAVAEALVWAYRLGRREPPGAPLKSAGPRPMTGTLQPATQGRAAGT